MTYKLMLGYLKVVHETIWKACLDHVMTEMPRFCRQALTKKQSCRLGGPRFQLHLESTLKG